MLWDDDPPAELRPRRTREELPLEGRVRSAAAGRRGSPGMPLQFEDPDDDGVLRPAAERFRAPRASWWRPATKTGRVFLALAALAALGGLAAAYLFVAHALERDARFRIAGMNDIQAAGLAELSRADLLPVFGADIGRNIFFVPLSERQRALEQIPWIARATVMRVLPDRIRVAIVERTPVAFTRSGQQIGLVDADGVLLAMSPKTMAERHYSFPVVTGIDPGDPAASRKARMAVYLRLMAELDAGGQHNSEDISEIDLTDPEDARVLMPEQGRDILAHFGDSHFLERYQRYKAHIAEWRRQYPHLKSVDLRYDNQVVLEMTSGSETADVAAGAPGNTLAAVAGPALDTGAKSKTAATHAQDKPAAKMSTRKSKAKHAAAKRAATRKSRPSTAAHEGRIPAGAESGRLR